MTTVHLGQSSAEGLIDGGASDRATAPRVYEVPPRPGGQAGGVPTATSWTMLPVARLHATQPDRCGSLLIVPIVIPHDPPSGTTPSPSSGRRDLLILRGS